MRTGTLPCSVLHSQSLAQGPPHSRCSSSPGLMVIIREGIIHPGMALGSSVSVTALWNSSKRERTHIRKALSLRLPTLFIGDGTSAPKLQWLETTASLSAWDSVVGNRGRAQPRGSSALRGAGRGHSLRPRLSRAGLGWKVLKAWCLST